MLPKNKAGRVLWVFTPVMALLGGWALVGGPGTGGAGSGGALPVEDSDPTQEAGDDDKQIRPEAQIGPTERAEFYHLSEGSEFVPYCALKLRVQEHNEAATAAHPPERSVSEHLVRHYHFIPDEGSEHNSLGLPIGVTARIPLANLIGFNCAACHVGKIPGTPASVVLGAPSAVDLRQFYDDLMPWLAELFQDKRRVRKVVVCMLHDYVQAEKAALLRDTGEAEAAAAEQLLVQTGELTPALVKAGRAPSAASEALALELERASEGPGSPEPILFQPSRAGRDAATRSSESFRALDQQKQTNVWRWLRARYKLAKALLLARANALELTLAVGDLPYTRPGPGRIDAFMTALNLMDPSAKLEMSAPVAFPHLWETSKLKWLHWDNNTNAVQQRNFGQAIGVGALFAIDPDTVDRTNPQNREEVIGTSLQVAGIARLEEIARKIPAPRWPFGGLDAARVDAGAKLYQHHCSACHEPNEDGSMPEGPGRVDAATDPERLRVFERNATGGQPLIEVLQQRLAAVEKAAKTEHPDAHPVWRTTGRYWPRSLRGIWATAPFLHNNSVPSLADLLRLEGERSRPEAFSVDYSRYDTERVGFGLGDASSPEFRTQARGNGNQGHDWGTALTVPEKRALIEYLKQL